MYSGDDYTRGNTSVSLTSSHELENDVRVMFIIVLFRPRRFFTKHRKENKFGFFYLRFSVVAAAAT